jgi:predicted glycosyl hydrolase (DUF1957 family)
MKSVVLTTKVFGLLWSECQRWLEAIVEAMPDRIGRMVRKAPFADFFQVLTHMRLSCSSYCFCNSPLRS